MKYEDSTRSFTQPQRSGTASVLILLCIAALLGLGTWLATSVLRPGDSVTTDTVEWTAAQHTNALVRQLRIQAATDITPEHITSIPGVLAGWDDFECNSRYVQALEPAVEQFRAIAHLSRIAGARHLEAAVWRTQYDEALEGAQSLEQRFPAECTPVVPVSYELPTATRTATGISLHDMLPLAPDTIRTWTQLYLLAETPQEHDLALAGLWQVLDWESDWQPGRSPLSFNTL